jgi:membrane protein involved in colicin uptake
VRVRLQEPDEETRKRERDGDQGVRKELEDQRKSEREAIEKAREVRSQLSWSENARKAEEKAKLDAVNHKSRPLLWIGVGVAILALLLRSWLRNRG